MDPVTVGILLLLVVGIFGILAVIFVIRAWIRTLKLMVKLAFYGFVTLVVVGAVGAGVAWVFYGDQIRALLAG